MTDNLQKTNVVSRIISISEILSRYRTSFILNPVKTKVLTNICKVILRIIDFLT